MTAPPNAKVPEATAVPAHAAVTLTSLGHPAAPVCFDDSGTVPYAITYACLILGNTGTLSIWSGSIELTSIDTTTSPRRLTASAVTPTTTAAMAGSTTKSTLTSTSTSPNRCPGKTSWSLPAGRAAPWTADLRPSSSQFRELHDQRAAANPDAVISHTGLNDQRAALRTVSLESSVLLPNEVSAMHRRWRWQSAPLV